MPRTRQILGHAALVALLAVVASGSGGTESIVLYNGQHQELTDALIKAFEQQTGIQVHVRSNDGVVLADQILQEGHSSPADVTSRATGGVSSIRAACSAACRTAGARLVRRPSGSLLSTATTRSCSRVG